MRAILQALTSGQGLSQGQARLVFEQIMAGGVTEPVLAGLLVALKTKGETVDELVGAALAMRAAAMRVNCPEPAIDTCGTGGDGLSTFNVSTTAAIVAAAAGATVAKHGNRSTTRRSGSTDVLEELGVDVDAEQTVVERCLADVRIGYLNAQRLHPAMKHAIGVRRALQIRTIFNLLGPLTNPAGVRRQVLGVSQPEHLDLLGRALAELGAEHAWVVHGHDGLCDLTVTTASSVVEVQAGQLRRFEIVPASVGLTPAPLRALLVASPSESAATIRGVLGGATGPCRDHTLLNAGAALVVAGMASDLADGVARAGEAVDSGQAQDTLRRWAELAPGAREASA